MTTIIVGALVTFVFGFIWYGPLFGKVWMKMMNITPAQAEEAQKKGMMGSMVLSIIMNLVSAAVVSSLFVFLSPETLCDFLKIVFVVWVGFVFPVHIGGSLWEGKSVKLTVFNALQNLISFKLLALVVFYLN